MKRRCLTAALAIAYLAFHLATVPHAHEAAASSEHDGSHIHVSWFEGEDSEPGHTHHGHSHSHAEHSHPPDRSTEPEHDSDAVYLSNDPGIGVIGKTLDAVDQLTVCPISAVPLLRTMETSICSFDAYSPTNCRTHCPLYLALRALRI
jgi:hypothetical protein